VIISVRHVPDPAPTGIMSLAAMPPVAGPLEAVVKGYGKRLALPAAMFGKKIMVSFFDVRGRLVERRLVKKAGMFVRPDVAEGIVVAKVKVVK